MAKMIAINVSGLFHPDCGASSRIIVSIVKVWFTFDLTAALRPSPIVCVIGRLTHEITLYSEIKTFTYSNIHSYGLDPPPLG